MTDTNRCFVPYCKNTPTRILKDHKNIYHWFCSEHFYIHCHRPCWSYNHEEEILHQRRGKCQPLS